MYRSSGRTRDGGSIVGAHSTFYSSADPNAAYDDVTTAGGDAAAGGSGEDSDDLLSKSPQIAELDQQIKVRLRENLKGSYFPLNLCGHLVRVVCVCVGSPDGTV